MSHAPVPSQRAVFSHPAPQPRPPPPVGVKHTLAKGIYFIANVGTTELNIDLLNRKAKPERSVISAPHHKLGDEYAYNQLWFIEAVASKGETYTVRNLVGGTFMSLKEENAANGTPIQGHSAHSGTSEEWQVHKNASDGSFKIQNVASKTFVSLANGTGVAGTPVHGWAGTLTDKNLHQHWKFSCISRTEHEVATALHNNPFVKKSESHKGTSSRGINFYTLPTDGVYLVVPQAALKRIWADSELGKITWRRDIFDCDDFAIGFKAEVAKWGNNHFRADGFGILCGVMFGDLPKVGHAFNWTLSDSKLSDLVFFEPQSGHYDPVTKYTPYFALF